jgi:hypothetical protein
MNAGAGNILQQVASADQGHEQAPNDRLTKFLDRGILFSPNSIPRPSHGQQAAQLRQFFDRINMGSLAGLRDITAEFGMKAMHDANKRMIWGFNSG